MLNAAKPSLRQETRAECYHHHQTMHLHFVHQLLSSAHHQQQHSYMCTAAVRCLSGVSIKPVQPCRAVNRHSIEHDLANLQTFSAAAAAAPQKQQHQKQQEQQQQQRRRSSKQDDLAQLNKLLGRVSSGMASTSVR
jgi:hypothetical protein